MAGALIGFLGLLVRPAPPGLETIAEVLQHYEANLSAHRAHGVWTPISWLLLLGGLATLISTVPRRTGPQWSDVALTFSVLFVVLGIVDSTMDGILLPLMGKYFTLTGKTATAAAATLGESLYLLMEALAGRFALAYALGVVFTGLALRDTRSHPDWLGWAGVTIGIGGGILAVAWVINTVPPMPPPPRLAIYSSLSC